MFKNKIRFENVSWEKTEQRSGEVKNKFLKSISESVHSKI
jgi:hypothetical protein